jgi:uncharacterized protein DUF1905
MMPKKMRFQTELIMGHKNIAAVLVPFAPERVWKSTPVMIDAPYSQRPQAAYLVAGTIDGTPFDGWIGKRWGRHFIIVDQALRKRANVAVGDVVELVVAPRASAAPKAPARPSRASGTRSPSRARPRSSGPGRRARDPSR